MAFTSRAVVISTRTHPRRPSPPPAPPSGSPKASSLEGIEAPAYLDTGVSRIRSSVPRTRRALTRSPRAGTTAAPSVADHPCMSFTCAAASVRSPR